MMFLINAIYASASIAFMLLLLLLIHYLSPTSSWGYISQALIFHQVLRKHAHTHKDMDNSALSLLEQLKSRLLCFTRGCTCASNQAVRFIDTQTQQPLLKPSSLQCTHTHTQAINHSYIRSSRCPHPRAGACAHVEGVLRFCAKAWAEVTSRDGESGCLCQSLAGATTSVQPLNLLGFSSMPSLFCFAGISPWTPPPLRCHCQKEGKGYCTFLCLKLQNNNKDYQVNSRRRR